MRPRSLLPVWIVLLVLISSACLPTPEPVIYSTVTPTITLTPSPTIDWFPATATSTPEPTREIERATPTPASQTGTVLLQDRFLSNAGWTLPFTSNGRVIIGSNELTINVFEPLAYLYATRQEPNLRDFYLEATLYAGLCSGKDEYGVLFRASPPSAYYRFGITCNGQVSLDRVYGGTASSPQPWVRTASVPSGAFTSSRVGITARGDTFQVYINDEFQFEASDPMLTGGLVGFYAKSAGQTAMTISVSDFVVYALPAVETNN